MLVNRIRTFKQDRWTDNGGKNQSRIKIVAEHVEFKPVFRKDNDPQAITEAAENGSEAYAEEREPEAEAVF